MNRSNHARRQVEARANEVVSRDLPPLTRRVLVAMVTRTAEGWHLFVRGDNAFLIGPGGVFAVLIRTTPPDGETVRNALRYAEERCAGLRGPHGQVLASSAIHLVVVLPDGSLPAGNGLYWSLPERELPQLFQRDALHLGRRHVDAIAAQIAQRLPDFLPLTVPAPVGEPAADGFLDLTDLTRDQLTSAQQRPFETWLTFLHPHQHAVTTRNYNGPARISGPAGTGKTVVALHRLRYLARRSVGPLLFTTFVRTLPVVHRASFHRLAPELADRVSFVNLHAWVRSFLATRGKSLTVDQRRIDDAFARAWQAHREPLEASEQHGYWRTEVDRVIKGRGVRDIDEYLKISRRGRSRRLTPAQKEHTWRLYEAYQDNLAARGVHDYNDMISVALAELARRPLDQPYAAVVVDEVQDITLTGLRLLRELAGDGQNRLLLIGDGQQQVYPGGWRLSDAGIPIQGRGEVLRLNYRNRAEVLGFAQRFDATNQVDDLDGAAGVALRDVESATTGGEIRSWSGAARDLPTALVEAVRTLPVPLGQTALIVFQHSDLTTCASILRSAGIPTLGLDHYTGESDDRLKIGTVHRAKGLDFQGVLVVQFEHVTASPSEQDLLELQGRQHLVAATRARDYLWWAVATTT